MVQSYVIYILLLLLCWAFAFLAQKYHSKWCMWSIVLFLTLISGLRSESVGIDTIQYFEKFDLISQGMFSYAYGLETSFKYFCYICLSIFRSNTVMLIILSLITNGCIIRRLWDFKHISSFSCMVLCYYMAFFFMSLNIIRQFCAVAIVFYSTRYLNQKKLLRFCIGVLIATVFHQTAVIGFSLLALACLRWSRLSRRQQIFFVCAFLCIPVILYYVVSILGRYQDYFANAKVDVGLMLIAKIAFLLGTLFYVFVLQRKNYFTSEVQAIAPKNKFNMQMIGICYFAGMCLTTVGYIFPLIERVGLYLYIFEGVYFGILLKSKSNLHKLLFGACIALFVCYGFIYSMTHNSQGTMPYAFFWQ